MVEVQLVRVTKRFGRVVAVDSVDLVFPEGRLTALLGPSGSGKSTILYLVAGIYKPTSGKILFDGRDVTHLKPNERNIGLVFQNYALYPHMRVYDNIAFPLRLRRLPESEIRPRVRRVAELLGLEELLDRYPAQLSGGQQQRVALARALVKEPSVLLLDEPLSNLDALLRLRIRTELRRLQQDLGITAIYVTHDQSEALAIADKVVVINRGRVQQEGDPQTVYREPANVFVATFIGNPPANIIPARVEHTPEGPCISLPRTRYCPPPPIAAQLARLAAREILIGFRPEDARIDTKPHPAHLALEAEVYTVEPLGRENIVNVKINGTIAKIITPPDKQYQPGTKVTVNIPREKLMLFDPKTTKNIKQLILEKHKQT